MEIFAETNKLMKLLADDKALKREYGRYYSKIKQRLLEFSVADNLSDISHLPPSRLHQLTGNRANQFAVDIGANWRITFYGYNDQDELTTDKETIVTISIIAITDYH